MWHQLWIPVLIPTLIIKSNCDVNKTDNDVFVRYAGHAEAEYSNEREPSTTVKVQLTKSTQTTTTEATTVKRYKKTTTMTNEDATDGVVFIPNSRQVGRRDEEEYDRNALKIKDIMMMKSVHDAMDKNFHVQKEIDSPNEDIVFITGKNYDNVNTKPEENGRRKGENYQRKKNYGDVMKRAELDCSNLDCNNTVRSTCGARFLDKEWRYRLFLNECYFRKVNCAYKHEISRYKQVSMDKCKNVGSHNAERPFVFKLKPMIDPVEKQNANARRSSSSRKSMTMNFDGQLCSHPCPVSCPEDYDPQCAISGTGQRRVFLNHCKLDHNSCSYSVVWHKRPLADCVGGKKADMRQNRGFIGWMHRVGIVDNQGRLVLE